MDNLEVKSRDEAAPVMSVTSNFSVFLLPDLSHVSPYCDLLQIAANIVAWYHTLLGTSGTS